MSMNALGELPHRAGEIVFYVASTEPGGGTREMIRLCPNGDIYVRGSIVENDKEVVEGLRQMLKLPAPHVEGRPRFERILEREVGQIDTAPEKP